MSSESDFAILLFVVLLIWASQKAPQTNERAEHNEIEKEYIQTDNYQLPRQDDEQVSTKKKMIAIQYEEQEATNHRKTEKIWTTTEISLFVEFLQDTGNIEKPTAKGFCEKLLHKYPNNEETLEQCQFKVGNIQETYLKPRQWKWESISYIVYQSKYEKPTFTNMTEIWLYLHELGQIIVDSNENISNKNMTQMMMHVLHKHQVYKIYLPQEIRKLKNCE